MRRTKKIFFPELILAVLVIFLIACGDAKKKDDKQKDMAGMHTTKTDMADMGQRSRDIHVSDTGLSSLLKPTNGFAISSISTTTLKATEVNPVITGLGKVAYDTREVGVISSRIAGRINQLFVKYRYQKINKGDKVMDIYSPELLTNQENLLFLLKSDPENTSLINATKERLQLLGMSQGQIQTVINSKRTTNTITVFSNYSGHIHEAGQDNAGMNGAPTAMKDVSNTTEPLSVREGVYVQKGQELFSVFDPGKVWVLLSIYTDNQDAVIVGNSVHIVSEIYPEREFDCRIDFIEPFFRKESKTLTARVHFNNAGVQIPIGSQVKATINTGKKSISTLPAGAVLSLGVNKIVFIKLNDGFKARKVIIGGTYNEQVEIVSGLSANDTVAVNAQFLMDSESFIQVKE